MFLTTDGAFNCAPQQGKVLLNFQGASSFFGAAHHSSHKYFYLASEITFFATLIGLQETFVPLDWVAETDLTGRARLAILLFRYREHG
ncbi:MAG: hypothetical protein ACJ8LG_25250 [Massilia sp.]